MADEVKEEPKKKKGMLPVIVVLALVLAGGGFFMVKSKGGPKEPLKIEAAEKETELSEFLVNLSDGTTYLRAKISVKLRKDFPEEQLVANIGSVEDAINLTLRAQSPRSIRTTEDLQALKKKLAEAINARLSTDSEPTADAKDEKAEEGQDVSEKKAVNPQWDSQTGPVLQVFFKSFATQ